MTKLFGIDIQAAVAKAIPAGDKGVPKVTLTKRTPGSRTVDDLAAGRALVSNSYVSRGVIDSFRRRFQRGPSTWAESTHRVLVIAKPFADLGVAPEPNDTLEVEGVTYSVVGVGRDPAVATYTCYVRA